MGKRITLDALREQIETKYGPFEIDLGDQGGLVRLLPMLRLGAKQRAKVSEVLTAMGTAQDGESVDLNALVEHLSAAVRVVCETDKQADALLAALGDDGAALQEVFTEYQQVTGLGEARPSDS